jgi:aryl-phospho-beta-D-glucosidase BglC (GH1 family)
MKSYNIHYRRKIMGKLIDLKKAAAVLLTSVTLMSAAAALPAVDETPLLSQTAITVEAASVGKVTGLTSKTLSNSEIKLSWKKVSGASGYSVCMRKNGKYPQIADVKSGSTLTYTVKNLPNATRENFKVRAYKTVKGKKVYGAYSNNWNTATNPQPAKGLKVSSVSYNSVKLSWTKIGCTNYRVFQLKNGQWKEIAKTTSTSYTVKNLSQKTTYKFKIRACKTDDKKANHYGKYSAEVSATTSKAPAVVTPVSQHGQLSVKGANIVDKNGKVFKIKGMSTHGIMWEDFSDILTKDSLKVLRDDWKVNTIRIAMYTYEWGGYCTENGKYQAQAKQKVKTGVENAKSLGMYAIIDWHVLNDRNPNTYKADAIKFFTEMAQTYKDYDNVIYEICNEPNGGITWTGGIKSYCQSVVSAIRKYDSDAIIICGTGTWSQDIDQVLGNKLSDKNCVYALHFYADTHRDWLRNRLQNCYNKGLPVLVSEFGTCDASGNGGYNSAESTKWLKLLDSLKVGYINWSACGKSETASAFNSGTNLKAIKSGTSQLTASGKFIRDWYRNH